MSDADISGFREFEATDLISALLPAEERYTGSYFAVAYARTEGRYLARAFRTPDVHSDVKHYLAMQEYTFAGFRVRGLRADRATLDATFETWVTSARVTGHRTVERQTPWSGPVVEIDEPIAPLIDDLWAHGVRTEHSCQGGKPTPTGPEEGFINYYRDHHSMVVECLASYELTNVEYEPGPSTRPELGRVIFDPVSQLLLRNGENSCEHGQS